MATGRTVESSDVLCETWCKLGNHSIPIITGAYLEGFRNYHANEALNDRVGVGVRTDVFPQGPSG